MPKTTGDLKSTSAGTVKPSSVPKPGYTTSTPLYPAVANLWVTLGDQSTKVNLDEVALRLFERMIESGKDPVGFVNAACAHMGVNSSLRLPWAEFRRNGHQFAIAQTMSVADAFFRRLAREYRAYGEIDPAKWKSQKGSEQLDALAALVENLPAEKAKAAHACPEFFLVQYYRAVRNRVIHRSMRDTDAVLQALLGDHEAHFRDNYGTIPNRFSEITYADCLLLTRAIHYYSRVLNQVCDLTPELVLKFHLSKPSSDVSSTETTGPTDKPLGWLRALRRLKGKPQRVAGVIAAFAKHYQMTKADASRFEDALRGFLHADDSAKSRRRAKEDSRQ